jgi:transcriptional regulator with XRE-family HTH domain
MQTQRMVQPTNDDIKTDLRMFGRNLCAAHERIGLDQTDFAKVAKCDRSRISRVECGKQAPKFDTLLALARAVQLKPAELLHGIGSAKSPPDVPDGDRATPRAAAAQFGANLKWARERAELSHEKLGSIAAADRSLISAWEKGRREPNLRTILKLARALEIPPALLLHGVESGPLA